MNKKHIVFILSVIFIILVGIHFLDSNYISTSKILIPKTKLVSKDYMLSSLNVTTIAQDEQKLIWIGTSAGINVFNGKDYVQFIHDTNDTTALPDDYINVLYRDKKGKMWVGTQNGLARYESGYRFHRFALPDKNENITSIEEEGNKIIVSNGKKFFCIDGEKVSLQNKLASHTASIDSSEASSVHSPLLKQELIRKPQELISTIFKDAGGNLWLGFRNAGYQVISTNTAIYSLANNNTLAKETQGMDITCLESTNDQILAGTTRRLFIYDTKNGEINNLYYKEIFQQIPPHKQGLVNVVKFTGKKICLVGNHEIVCAETNSDGLLLGNRTSNLSQLGCGTRVGNDVYASCASPYIIRYTYGSNHADSIAFKNEWYDEETQLTTLSNDEILLFMKDMHLAILSTKTGKVNEMQTTGIEHTHNIDPAFARQDSKGNIWLGTKRSGLYRLNLKSKKIEKTNFINDVHIQAIIEDKRGQIWITTLKDATCYQPLTGAVLMNSLVSSSQNEWNRQYFDNSICLAPNGNIILGSSDGCIFLPSISGDKDLLANKKEEGTYDNATSQEKGLCIYSLDIKDTNGKELTVNKKEDHYTFSYKQNDLTFSFFYPNYSRRSSMQFQYMLEGDDKQWSKPTYEHEANFINLAPGEYTFRLRLLSSVNLPPLAERSIRITIKPPFWLSPAAWLLYALMLGLILYYINSLYLRIRTNKMLLEQEQHQRELEQRTNEMNMSFFANISHEFRNPITIIAGPLMALKADATLPGQVQTTINRVCISVNRMLRLIDQMLDFNQLETDALRLRISEVDILQQLLDLCSTFEESTKVRNISLITEFSIEKESVWIDTDKFEKIVSNLFTNALKHTSEKGVIKISASYLTTQTGNHEDRLVISIFNSGSHIEESKLQDVFKRYYQLADTQTEHHYGWGTGIGLYYVKRLVGLHHGDIQVSNKDNGVEFRFQLPILKQQYPQIELAHEKTSVMQIPIEKNIYGKKEENKKNGIKILIVDDDIDVAQYIRSIFADDYIVENRYSAEEALNDMEKISPDIILSDIIMGQMSGYEFCKTLKGNLLFSHIPVVLITAKSNINEQIEGLKLGAVAYITKPFDPGFLKALVESQLHNIQILRQRLGENTETNALSDAIADTLSEQDRKFMDELYSLMEKRTAEQELSVPVICHDLLISQSKFTYKLKELTGHTPGTFFRKYKLNKAAQLLREGKHNVSEISTLVGFSTAAHFSVAFKKQFGISPSEYH